MTERDHESNHKTSEQTLNGSSKSNEGKDLENNTESAKEKTPNELLQPYIVSFHGSDDPLNPHNWPLKKKARMTLLLGLMTFCGTFSSTTITSSFNQLQDEFGISMEVAILTSALFILGFAAGPLIFSPLSEQYGRKISIVTPFFISGLFSIGSATSKTAAGLILCRFWGGFFASAPVSSSGGAIADLYTPDQRATAIVFYVYAIAGGPTIGPLISAALQTTSWRWRGGQYVQAMLIFVITFLCVAFLKESYPPEILRREAKRMRQEKMDWRYHAKAEEKSVTSKELLEKVLTRPIVMLTTEPIVILFVLYASFVYGILYLSFEAYPIEFVEYRGWAQIPSTLVFLAVFIGVVIAGIIQILYNPRYAKLVHKNGGKPVPEARLRTMMLGAIIYPIGLFIFAWTSYPWVPWIAPVIGIAVTSLGFLLIFQQSLNYLIDSYQMYSASAVAANTFLRSLFACSFQLFAPKMFHALTIKWGMTLIACISICLMPVPFLFSKYGAALRKKSKFAPQVDW